MEAPGSDHKLPVATKPIMMAAASTSKRLPSVRTPICMVQRMGEGTGLTRDDSHEKDAPARQATRVEKAQQARAPSADLHQPLLRASRWNSSTGLARGMLE